MTGRVAGRVALVTGAARGQGRAEAIRLGAEGASIVAIDVCAAITGPEWTPAASAADLDETVRLVESAGGTIVPIIADTRSSAQMTDAASTAVERFGRIDIVVANAGIGGATRLAQDLTDDEWQTIIDTNLTGSWRTVKAALPHMIAGGRGGSIVLVSSAAALKPMMHTAAYGAAKAGLHNLTKVLALENGRHGIRVNCIAPGSVETPMVMNESTFKLFRPDLENPTREDVVPVFASLRLLEPKAMLDPADIANAVLFLVSDEGSSMTGTIVPVDLGVAIN